MHSKALPSYCISGRPLEPKGAVIHFFSCKYVDPENKWDMTACRRLFLDLNRPQSEREWYLLNGSAKRMYASAHLLIGRDGTTWKLVNFDKQAYHAGASILNGRQNCNGWTLGIELVGDETSGFTDEQYVELRKILDDQMAQHNFGWSSIAGHDQVRHSAILAGMTSAKKYDPSGQANGLGTNFDWERLRSMQFESEPDLKAGQVPGL